MKPPGPSRLTRYWPLGLLAVLLMAPPALAAVVAVLAVGTRLALLAAPALERRRAQAQANAAGEATLLGIDGQGRQVMLSDRELAAHALIVGASGAGKSTTLLRVLTDHVRRGRPVVAIDMKGSPAFAAELEAAARAAGRPFRLWTLDGPTVWNPLRNGNATELKDKLIATERFTEPHYQRAAERYVQAALTALRTVSPGSAPTLDQVVELMEPRRLGALAGRLPGSDAQRLRDYLASLTPDQLSAVRGLGTRLALLSESSSGPFLSPGRGSRQEIDLRGALDGDEVVLFSLNSSRYGRLAAQVGTLVVQDLTAAAGDRLERGPEAPSRQAAVGVDEFSALGADNVLHLLARGREAGLPVLLATQELTDLERAAPGLRDQVLGIVGVKIAHRQDVPASAQTFAQLAGTETVWESTHQLGSSLFGSYATGRGTSREVERFLAHPNEIKRLETGEAVVISKLPRTSVRTVRVTPPPPQRSGPRGSTTRRGERSGPELG